MKETREQKGITLVALIITIVVLLILAVVTINSIKNDGIIDYATNARDDYQAKQGEEENTLQNVDDLLSSISSSGGQSLTIAKLKVGDYVTYEPDSSIREVTINGLYDPNNLETGKTYIPYSSGAYDSDNLEHQHPTPQDNASQYINQTVTRQSIKWQVLKNDGKNIYLISETPISSVTLGAMPGYLNGEKILNEVCNKLYGGSKGVARSINVEDINSIFRPTFNANLATKWTYKDAQTKKEEPLTEATKTIRANNLNLHQYVRLTESELDLEANYYAFDPGNKKNGQFITEEESEATYKGINAPYKTVYDLVFNAFDSDDTKYWVASKTIHITKNTTVDGATVDQADFGLRYIKNGYMSQEYLTNGGDCDGIGHEFTDCGIDKTLYYRPIVVLNGNLEFEEAAGTDNTWNIK